VEHHDGLGAHREITAAPPGARTDQQLGVGCPEGMMRSSTGRFQERPPAVTFERIGRLGPHDLMMRSTLRPAPEGSFAAKSTSQRLRTGATAFALSTPGKPKRAGSPVSSSCPSTSIPGFVFTNLDRRVKGVNVDLIGGRGAHRQRQISRRGARRRSRRELFARCSRTLIVTSSDGSRG
jgi:hypothetical protein